MSFKDKFKSIIGIEEEDYFIDEEIEIPMIESPAARRTPEVAPVVEFSTINANPQPVDQTRQSLRAVEQPPKQQNTSRGQVSAMNANAMMSKVIIREPKEYSDASNIADCLKEGLPVFVNLQRLDKGQGRRVIDFLSGTTYAVDGVIQRVGNDLFLCTPNSVQTDGAVTESNSDELTLGEL